MILVSSPLTEVSLETAPLKIIDGDRGTNYPKQTDFSDSGYCLFLNTGNVTSSGFNFSNCNFISQEKDAALRKGRLQKYDVVLTTRGTVGNTAWVDEAVPYPVMRINSGMVILRPDIEKILPDYIYFFLRSSKFQDQVNALRSGSAQPQLPIQVLKNIKLPLPPIAEQRRIAAILDRADAVRRKRQQAIALTEELLRSAFLEMFGDPVTNPKGWEMVTVGDIVSDVRDGPHVSPEYSEGGIPILSTRNIRPGRLVMDDVKYVSHETYSKLVKQFRPQYGDVLLTKGGTTGFAKAVDWDWPFAIWVHLAALRPTERIRSEFLESALNSPSCYVQSQRYTHGIANRDLGLTRIRKIRLSLPPLYLQDQFCQLRRGILRKLSTQEQSEFESEKLFNSLLQRAFRGEL